MVDRALHEVLDWDYYARLVELSPEATRCVKLGGIAFRLAGRDAEILLGIPPNPTPDSLTDDAWAGEFVYKRLQILRFLAMIKVKGEQLDGDDTGSN
jgi:hypothetical protein